MQKRINYTKLVRKFESKIKDYETNYEEKLDYDKEQICGVVLKYA